MSVGYGGGFGGGGYGGGGGGYTTTSYGAQGGAEGGGFMQGSQGGGSQNEQGTGTYGTDTLRPVTIKQAMEADHPHPDAKFKIDGVEVALITFVGQIRNISTQTTNVTYKLDDGTSTIEVKQWIDSEDRDAMDTDDVSGPPKPKLVENDWARVWGKLKEFSGKRHLGAHVIRPITDKMDITYHLLEATAVHLYFSKGPLEAVKKEEPGTAVNGGGVYESEAYGGGAGGDQAGRVLNTLSVNARKVYNTLKNSPQSNEGLHVQSIASYANMNVNDAVRAGEELQTNNLIFSTVDDNTWALLEY